MNIMNAAATATLIPEPPGRQPGNKHDIVLDGFIHLAPRTHDISLVGEHIPSISCLAADLDKAVQAAWPRRHDIRYSKVEVLLVRWADDDLGVSAELKDLQHVFADLYHFQVETYDIPSHKPNNALSRRVLDFLENDKEETLFILYYAGHGKTSPQSNEGAIWFANRKPESPSVPSKVIQSKFEEVDSDVLLLYDCCNAAATTASSYRGHRGVTEVIAACGYESIAAEVGRHSFSDALIETLAAASKEPPVSVAELHARVLNRLKCWTPSFVKNKDGKFSQDAAGRLNHEIQPRRTPIYGILCETTPRRSIALGPLRTTTPLSNGIEQVSSTSTFTSSPMETNNAPNPTDSEPNSRKRKRCDGTEPQCPQILLAIRLDKHELDISAWKECLLRQLPSEAKGIKIEGIYGSFSTLLLLQIPVIVWDLLPQNPAYTFVGFITSENMAFTDSPGMKVAETLKSKVAAPPCRPGESTQQTNTHGTPSLCRPTKYESDEPQLLTESDTLPSHFVQETVLPEVDEPHEETRKPPSRNGFQKPPKFNSVGPAMDFSILDSSDFGIFSDSPSTALLPLAGASGYHEGSLQERSGSAGDEEPSAKHVKVDLDALPAGEQQPHQNQICRPYSQDMANQMNRHTQEEHVQPHENPVKYAQDNLADLLGLDSQGKPKSSPASGQASGAAAEVRERRRASRPKVKSGCFTCKLRRIKCDESKPQCLRCQKFGRICDGYPEPPSSSGRSVIPVQPRIPSITLYTPPTSIYSTEDEGRYFDFFREKVAGKMAGFFNSIFWTGVVLQESHTVPAIRHAANSIGALFKSMEGASGPSLKVNIVQTFDKKHHECAVIQYLKAINALNQYISATDPPAIRTALIACILFACFEAMQGSYALAVQQIYGGIKMLRGYYVGQTKLQRKSTTTPLSGGSEVQKSDFINPALRHQMARDSMLNEGWVVSLIEDHLENGTILRKTINLASEKGSGYHPLPEESRNSHHKIGDDQPSQDGRDSPPTGADIGSLSRHSPQPSEIFSTVETNFATLSTVSEILTPTFKTTALGASQLLALQIKGEHAGGGLGRGTIPRAPLNDLVIEDTIIETIIRVDCYSQGLFFGIVPTIPPLIWDIHNLYHVPLPATFTDFADAHRCWDFLMDRALQFYRRTLFNRAYGPQIADSRESILIQYRSYMSQLAAFKHAFEPILRAACTPAGTVTDPAALAVSVYYHCTLITLSVVTSDSEMVYDAFLSNFRYILDTCARLVSHSKDGIGTPRFVFDIGIIPPLHLTATKCRDPVLRREAMHLLLASHRQEGMWDSVLSARIAKWVAFCEEEGLPSSPAAQRDEVAEEGRGMKVRMVPTAGSGAIEKWLEKLSEYADNVDLVDIVGMEDDGVAAEDIDSTVGTPKMETIEEMALNVPEENRVRLTVVDFHIPERYIKVQCQKVLLRSDGSKEERETVIAW